MKRPYEKMGFMEPWKHPPPKKTQKNSATAIGMGLRLYIVECFCGFDNFMWLLMIYRGVAWCVFMHTHYSFTRRWNTWRTEWMS